MIEAAKGLMNKGGHFSALLTDLLKTFDCLLHDLIIAKLDFMVIKMMLYV